MVEYCRTGRGEGEMEQRAERINGDSGQPERIKALSGSWEYVAVWPLDSVLSDLEFLVSGIKVTK